jgi:hypothetical protein
VAEAIKRASIDTADMSEGGGNLFGSAAPVRARITGGRFTKEAPNENYTSEGNPIFGVADYELLGLKQEEGETAEEFHARTHPNQSYACGPQSGDNFTISEDGQYLIPNNDESKLVKTSKFGIYAAALKNEKVPASILSAFGWDLITGLVGDFKRVADPARDFADSGRANARKSKYPPSTLVLVKLVSLPGQAASAATTTTAAPAAQGGTSPAAQTAAATSGEDFDLEVYGYLEPVLKAAGAPIQKSQLTLKVSKAAMDQGTRRTAIAQRATSDDFLKKMVDAGVVVYDPTVKPQVVSLAA